jgi:predicted esterase
MSDLTFDDLSRQVFRLYHEQAYAQAYELIVREASRFPEQEARLLYWRACFACLLNDPLQGLQVLQQAIASGYWYAPDQLRTDPDLAELQAKPEFEQLVQVSQTRLDRAQKEGRPELRVEAPDASASPYPLLMVLHGQGVSDETFNVSNVDHWRPAMSAGWLLAAPRSSLIVGLGQYGWGDFSEAACELKAHHEALGSRYALDASRFVTGGFSRGAMLATWVALKGILPVHGFIAVASGGANLNQPEFWMAAIETPRAGPVRGYFIVGEADAPSYTGTCALVETLNAHGIPCKLEQHPGLAHAFPATFTQSLADALEFIFQNQ